MSERQIPVCGCAAPEEVDRFPVPLCAKCGRLIVSPPADTTVDEYMDAFREFSARVPVEQSYAAADRPTTMGEAIGIFNAMRRAALESDDEAERCRLREREE
jgi:hypothetical protein